MKLITLIVSNFLLSIFCNAQQIELLNSGSKSSLRGLCVVDENIVWASGSNGTVLKSTNGGKSFETIAVKGFEKRDFRDIEAFDSNTIIIMAIAEPAQILKTNDGGKTWNIVFTDSTKGMFLDAMYFKDDKNGIVIGDPINNKTFLAITSDGGNSWQTQSHTNAMAEGEAFFASSGSNIFLHKKDRFIVSGGKHSNLYYNEQKFEIPINKGLESTGANSISVYKNIAIIVGGDFKKDADTTGNCVLFSIKTKQFIQPTTHPTGYRSCVIQLHKGFAITCGINGVDMSNDNGLNWKNISKEGFHVVAKAKKGKAIFFAGSKGKIAKLVN